MKRRAESRDGMIMLSIGLPKDLHRELAIAGLDDNASMNALVREAIQDWLARREKQRASTQPRKGGKR